MEDIVRGLFYNSGCERFDAFFFVVGNEYLVIICA